MNGEIQFQRLGMLGGGQLGQMVAQQAIEWNIPVTVLDPTPNCPAAQVGARQIVAKLTDTDAITQLAAETDLLTAEIEHFPAEHAAILVERGVRMEPSPKTFLMVQDKLPQKQTLTAAGIPVAPFSSFNEAVIGAPFLGGGPFVVKTRRGGYDGRGNLVVDLLDDTGIAAVDAFCRERGIGRTDLYVEKKLDFEKELSVIAARDRKGNVVTYPVVETIHDNNICHLVLAPAPVEPEVTRQAEEIARATMTVLEGAGVFAIEMFVVDGQVLVNEIAPRPHNSGHFSLKASQTSQFEQHLRAIFGMRLGPTDMLVPAAAMINILGINNKPLPRAALDAVTALPDVHLRYYGKEPRELRKIGHIIALGASIDLVHIRAELALRLHDEAVAIQA